jgi:hypothetical protein
MLRSYREDYYYGPPNPTASTSLSLPTSLTMDESGWFPTYLCPGAALNINSDHTGRYFGLEISTLLPLHHHHYRYPPLSRRTNGLG